MKSTVLEKATKFKPVALFTNEIAHDELNKFIENKILLTETVSQEAKKVLQRSLTDIEKIHICEGSIKFVKDEIKATYLFDDAEESFNLSSLGVSYTKLDEVHAKLISWPIKVLVEYDKKSDTYKVLEDERIRILDQAITYTSNPFQNEVLKASQSLIKALDRCQKYGVFSPMQMPDFADISKQIITAKYVGDKMKFTINENTISRLEKSNFDLDSY